MINAEWHCPECQEIIAGPSHGCPKCDLTLVTETGEAVDELAVVKEWADTASGKRPSFQPALTPTAEADFERLWCQTSTRVAEISRHLLAVHGIEIAASKLGDHALRRGFRRYVAPGQFQPPASREERLNTASLDRERGGTTDNRRIHGPRYPVPVGGYRTRATMGE